MIDEESVLESPLDKIEPYQLFRDTLMSKCMTSFRTTIANNVPEMQAEQPSLYESLTKILNAEEQNVVQQVINQAQANATAAAQAAALVETGMNGGNPQPAS